MNKRTRLLIGLAAVGLGLLLARGSALAHDPSVNITAIGGQDATSGNVSLSVALLPTVVNIDGTVTHESPGNVSGVSLEVSDNGTVFYSGSPFSGAGNVGSANFSVPWTISSVGNHHIVATAVHGAGDGTDTVIVVIELNVFVGQCPAAPAIAADYMMNDLGMKPVSGQFKWVLKQVAWETGSDGDYWAGWACESWYPGAVETFVDGLLS